MITECAEAENSNLEHHWIKDCQIGRLRQTIPYIQMELRQQGKIRKKYCAHRFGEVVLSARYQVDVQGCRIQFPVLTMVDLRLVSHQAICLSQAGSRTRKARFKNERQPWFQLQCPGKDGVSSQMRRLIQLCSGNSKASLCPELQPRYKGPGRRECKNLPWKMNMRVLHSDSLSRCSCCMWNHGPYELSELEKAALAF